MNCTQHRLWTGHLRLHRARHCGPTYSMCSDAHFCRPLPLVVFPGTSTQNPISAQPNSIQPVLTGVAAENPPKGGERSIVALTFHSAKKGLPAGTCASTRSSLSATRDSCVLASRILFDPEAKFLSDQVDGEDRARISGKNGPQQQNATGRTH